MSKKPVAFSLSKTAQLQFMTMTPQQQAQILEAIERITRDPGKGVPAEEYLKTLPPEQAEAYRKRLREAMDEDKDPEVTQ